MADAPKLLVSDDTLSGTGVLTRYTVPASTTTIVRNVRIVNRSSSGITVKVWMPNGWLYDTPIGANSVYDWSGFSVLRTGDNIQIQCATTAVSFHASGVEVT